MELSDRIAVMYRGEFVDVLPGDQVTKAMIGLLMAGVNPNDARKSKPKRKKKGK